MVHAKPLLVVWMVVLVDCFFSEYFVTVLSVITFTLLPGIARWIPWQNITLQNVLVAQEEL